MLNGMTLAARDLIDLLEWAETDRDLRAAVGGYKPPQAGRAVKEPRTDIEIARAVAFVINSACERNGLAPFLTDFSLTPSLCN